ncbi:MAG TPA: serine hydrolase domain-containing protein [Longimicrobiales bacterium]|nr:serine hydrolase domain-containing protein [Longimicrobiales bacterium]
MHRIPALFSFAVAVAPALPASPLLAQLPPAFDTEWRQVAERWRRAAEEQGVVGASLALLIDGRVARLETQGMADLERGLAVDEETIYHWASITKTFTAISVLQLRDRGLLDLDDPVVEYVPELRDVHDPFGPIEEVTIRTLLSHSAGFRGATWPWGGDQDWHPHEPTEWSQLVAMMPYTRIEFEPGSKFAYSNPGIVFLGRVIEKVTGDVFEAYVDKNLFRPLGMRRAYFDTTPWHLLPHRSNHYFVRNGKPEAGGIDFNTGITVSNGGLNAPIPDMARYLAFLVGSPPDDVDADAVLARSSLEEMWHTVVPIGDSGIGRESMGLSFFLYDHDGRGLVGHTGTQRAFHSFFIVDPEARVAAIGAYNTVGEDGGAPRTHDLRVGTRDEVVRRIFPLFTGGAR